jgi:hypothetical protein
MKLFTIITDSIDCKTLRCNSRQSSTKSDVLNSYENGIIISNHLLFEQYRVNQGSQY